MYPLPRIFGKCIPADSGQKSCSGGPFCQTAQPTGGGLHLDFLSRSKCIQQVESIILQCKLIWNNVGNLILLFLSSLDCLDRNFHHEIIIGMGQ